MKNLFLEFHWILEFLNSWHIKRIWESSDCSARKRHGGILLMCMNVVRTEMEPDFSNVAQQTQIEIHENKKSNILLRVVKHLEQVVETSWCLCPQRYLQNLKCTQPWTTPSKWSLTRGGWTRWRPVVPDSLN